MAVRRASLSASRPPLAARPHPAYRRRPFRLASSCSLRSSARFSRLARSGKLYISSLGEQLGVRPTGIRQLAMPARRPLRPSPSPPSPRPAALRPVPRPLVWPASEATSRTRSRHAPPYARQAHGTARCPHCRCPSRLGRTHARGKRGRDRETLRSLVGRGDLELLAPNQAHGRHALRRRPRRPYRLDSSLHRQRQRHQLQDPLNVLHLVRVASASRSLWVRDHLVVVFALSVQPPAAPMTTAASFASASDAQDSLTAALRVR